MKKFSFAHFCAYLSLTISIIMLVLWCCNVGGFSVVSLDSFVGIIVALLAIIVTLAIGWQIYNSIEIKDKIKKLDALEEKYSEHDYKMNQIQSNSLHLIWASLGDLQFANKTYTSAIDYYLKSLDASIYLDKPQNIDVLLTRLEKAVNSLECDTQCDFIDYIKDCDNNIRSSKNYYIIKQRYEKIYHDMTTKIKENDDKK